MDTQGREPLELWFEFASTYSYLGVEAAAAIEPAVRYRPFLLGPIFAAQGMHDSPFNLYPRKGQYMLRDLERLCAAAGLPWRKPSVFPRSGLLTARVACDNAQAAWLPAFCRNVYRANFGHDRDISDRGVIAELLADLGVDAASALERAHTPAAKQALRSQTERAEALGIFGAPTWVIGRELFWGADRLEQALAFWRRSNAEPR